MLAMSVVHHLAPGEWPPGRPFTNPDLAEQDSAVLRRLIGDLHGTSGKTTEAPRASGGKDRLITTESGRAYGDGPMAIVGFFGDRRVDGCPVVAEQVEEVNSEMVSGFEDFPILLGYVSCMLEDEFNFANLVVLRGADGISKWRELPEHVTAVEDLAPKFYTSVRIYNGVLPQGLTQADLLQLQVVKYWDYTKIPMWHAVRELSRAN